MRAAPDGSFMLGLEDADDGSTLSAHARALAGALDALGMRAGLDADAVGRCVLRELDALDSSLAAVTGRASLAEFRALLAARFEEVAYIDRQVESPVVMVSISACLSSGLKGR